jgi:hypothetical protein
MQDIRTALATILTNDATIISYLGAGAASIVNERDIIGDDNPVFPIIAISTQGSKTLGGMRDVTSEEWTLRIFNQNKGYATIDLVKYRCKQLLHDQPAALQAAMPKSGEYFLNRSVIGCQWVWWTPEYYDNDFNAENGGVRFRITMQEIAYS